MTTAAIATLPLYFAKSESKAVGFSGSLMDKLRDNAPRIVGSMKIAMDATMGWAGISGLMGIGGPVVPGAAFLIGYAALAIVGRVIMIAWGTKKNQHKLAQQHGDDHEVAHNALEKALRPKEYPMESSSAVSVLAEASGVGYGITQLANSIGESGLPEKGYTSLILGLLAVLSYANILFGKEKGDQQPGATETAALQQGSLVFAKSHSKQVGWFSKLRQTMKENPVLTSSLTNVGLCVAAILGGSLEGQSAWYVTAFVLGALANGVQALLVKKREFNLDGALEDKHAGNLSHTQKIQQQRASREQGDWNPSLA